MEQLTKFQYIKEYGSEIAETRKGLFNAKLYRIDDLNEKSHYIVVWFNIDDVPEIILRFNNVREVINYGKDEGVRFSSF